VQGSPKHATADDGVHNQRNQAPAADGADEFVARRADNSRFCHREFVPQTGAAWRESPDFAPDFAQAWTAEAAAFTGFLACRDLHN
jgi:hypothetical protein